MFERPVDPTATKDQFNLGFAGPHFSLDRAYFENTVTSYHRRVLRTLITRAGPLLIQQGAAGLLELLQTGLTLPPDFETCWDVAFGKVLEKLLPGEDNTPADLIEAAVALGLRFHEVGLNGRWRIQLEKPARLRWGRWLLPLADRLEVVAGSGRAYLKLGQTGSTSSEVQLWQTEAGWQAQGVTALPLIGGLERQILLLLPAAPESLEYEGNRPALSENTVELMLAKYNEAFLALQNQAPAYLTWVTRVIRLIVPTAWGPLQRPGGSDIYRPGGIHLFFEMPGVAIAERLVHESAHQYFHILYRAGKLDDGSDPALYFSPMAGREGPLFTMLLTYHAYANQVLFYRMGRENGAEDCEYFDSQEQSLLPKLEQLEGYLSSSRAITPLGRTLWEPLAKCLHNSYNG